MAEELYTHHCQALVLCGESSVKITVPAAGLPGLAATLRRKLNDPHRMTNEAISLKGTSGKLIINPKDAQALLDEVVRLMGQATHR